MYIGVYPGQYFDTETGLHYNYFRYYDPETGTYTTPDPIGQAGGINLYAYVLNDPVNFVDPNGLLRFLASGTSMGISISGGNTGKPGVNIDVVPDAVGFNFELTRDQKKGENFNNLGIKFGGLIITDEKNIVGIYTALNLGLNTFGTYKPMSIENFTKKLGQLIESIFSYLLEKDEPCP